MEDGCVGARDGVEGREEVGVQYVSCTIVSQGPPSLHIRNCVKSIPSMKSGK